jgi:hypothetical protein
MTGKRNIDKNAQFSGVYAPGNFFSSGDINFENPLYLSVTGNILTKNMLTPL